MTHRAPQTTPGPRHRRGTGSVEQLPSGRWRVRLPGRSLAAQLPTFDTRELAESARRGTLAILAAEAAEQVVPAADSLERAGARWIDAREAAGDSRSVDTWRSQWRAHVEGTELGRSPLRDVTAVLLREWVQAMRRKPALVPTTGERGARTASKRRLHVDTIGKVLSQVRQVLEAACEAGHLAANVAVGVRVRAPVADPDADDVWTYLTLAELGRLEACDVIPEPLRIVYLVAAYTGLRQGELWGLHWRDVHLQGDPHVWVKYSHQGPPKNGRRRRVPLFERAAALLTRWREIAPESEEGLVFVTKRGGRRGRSDDARWADFYGATTVDGVRVNKRFPGYQTRLELGRDVRFHDLRHTTASHLVMGSWGRVWSLPEIAAMLGHSDTKVTERYAHLADDHLARAARETAVTAAWEDRSAHAPPTDSSKPLARPRGLEPLASRSVEGCSTLENPMFPVDRGQIVGRSRAVLTAVATTRRVSEADIVELARAVLGWRPLGLAQELLQAPQTPHRVRLALELAAAVILDMDSVECADSADSADSAPTKHHGTRWK
jgi:integrase